MTSSDQTNSSSSEDIKETTPESADEKRFSKLAHSKKENILINDTAIELTNKKEEDKGTLKNKNKKNAR